MGKPLCDATVNLNTMVALNQVLSRNDKLSFKSAALPGASSFLDFIDQNALMDLCVKGPALYMD